MNTRLYLRQLQLLLICVSASVATIESGTQIPSTGSVLDTYVAWFNGHDPCSERTVFGGTSPCGTAFNLNGGDYTFSGCNGGSPASVLDVNGTTIGICSERSATSKVDCTNSVYPVYWEFECVLEEISGPAISSQISPSSDTASQSSPTLTTTEQPQSTSTSSESTTLPVSTQSGATSSDTLAASSPQSTVLSSSTTFTTSTSNTTTASAATSSSNTSTSSSGISTDTKANIGIGLGTFVVTAIGVIIAWK